MRLLPNMSSWVFQLSSTRSMGTFFKINQICFWNQSQWTRWMKTACFSPLALRAGFPIWLTSVWFGNGSLIGRKRLEKWSAKTSSVQLGRISKAHRSEPNGFRRLTERHSTVSWSVYLFCFFVFERLRRTEKVANQQSDVFRAGPKETSINQYSFI